MENLRVVIGPRVFIGTFVLVVGLLFIPLSRVPSIERQFYAQPSTQPVAEGTCPPQISVYLDNGSYRIRLGGRFFIGPSTRVEVRDGIGNVVYQSSIDAQKRGEQHDFDVASSTTYIVTIENGAAYVELFRLVGQTVWFESVTYPSQPLVIIGIAMAIMGTAILLRTHYRLVASIAHTLFHRFASNITTRQCRPGSSGEEKLRALMSRRRETRRKMTVD